MAMETRDETVDQQVRVMLYYLFFTLFISPSHSSSFPLSTVQQKAGTGGTQRGRRRPRSNTGRDRGAGKWEEEVERLGLRSKEGGGGGGERGEQGTETAGQLDDREGDLDKRAAAADKEDERAGQGKGWATLLLSCLLLDFEICKVQ